MVIATIGQNPAAMGNFGGDIRTRLEVLALRTLSEYDVFTVLTCLSPGWCQAIAAACITLDIPYIAALPCEVTTERMSSVDRLVFEDQLHQASSIIPISAEENPAKEERMHRWLVDTADLVLALWNGEPGPVAHCVRWAAFQGVPIKNVWDQFAADG